MELLLNVIWLSVAAAGFVLVPKRSSRIWLVLACTAVLLFPIISASDDINAVRMFNDAAAAIVVTIVLCVAFVAIARLRSFPARVYAVHVASPSDPRSPPAR
jgi:UDP-N-acetylmuramyl pentapeptide phosphotransferase/UDP-N-acetylglucosamine-1-phosphate transferase